MYKFKVNIDPFEHDEFIKKNNGNLLQSSSWAKIKDNWNSVICGVYENNILVTSSLILQKELFGFKVFYIPKGPIINFNNQELVSFYFDKLKEYAKKENCIFIKFDPEIYDELIHNEQKEVFNNEKIIEFLNENNCFYYGKTRYIKESIQPRYCMTIRNKEDLEKLPRRTKKSYRSAIKKGVFTKREDLLGVDKFCNLIEMTQSRKNVSLRNKEYFLKLLNTYKEDAYLYITYVNLCKRLEEIQKEIQLLTNQEKITNQEKNNLQNLENEKNIIVDLRKKYNDDIIPISGCLMVGFGERMEMLYAGMNNDFRSFYPQYLTYLTMFEQAFNDGYKHISMGGVEGDFKDGLSNFKLAFNPWVEVYIGEFDFVIKKVYYFMYKLLLKIKKMI